MAGKTQKKSVDATKDDEITIERRVRTPEAAREPIVPRETRRIARVDARLLAIARGEREPGERFELLILDDPFDGLNSAGDPAPAVDDPFGGLIPVYDDDDAEEILDEWLLEADEPEPITLPRPPVTSTGVPRVCLAAADLLTLPLTARSGFILSHIDGQRSVDDLVAISHLSPEDTLELVAVLVALGAIAID